MSHEPEEPTETTPCSGCGEDTPEDQLAAIGADPSSEYRLCPVCVRAESLEAARIAAEDAAREAEQANLPPCCRADILATPPERAYAAYNRAGDPATAGLNFRVCPVGDRLWTSPLDTHAQLLQLHALTHSKVFDAP
jgi:hypothetical protein